MKASSGTYYPYPQVNHPPHGAGFPSTSVQNPGHPPSSYPPGNQGLAYPLPPYGSNTPIKDIGYPYKSQNATQMSPFDESSLTERYSMETANTCGLAQYSQCPPGQYLSQPSWPSSSTSKTSPTHHAYPGVGYIPNGGCPNVNVKSLYLHGHNPYASHPNHWDSLDPSVSSEKIPGSCSQKLSLNHVSQFPTSQHIASLQRFDPTGGRVSSSTKKRLDEYCQQTQLHNKKQCMDQNTIPYSVQLNGYQKGLHIQGNCYLTVTKDTQHQQDSYQAKPSLKLETSKERYRGQDNRSSYQDAGHIDLSVFRVNGEHNKVKLFTHPEARYIISNAVQLTLKYMPQIKSVLVKMYKANFVCFSNTTCTKLLNLVENPIEKMFLEGYNKYQSQICSIVNKNRCEFHFPEFHTESSVKQGNCVSNSICQPSNIGSVIPGSALSHKRVSNSGNVVDRFSTVPAISHYSSAPNHMSPAPSLFSPAAPPSHFSPTPSHFSPTPSHFSPAPSHFSPAPRHFSPAAAPSHFSPTPRHFTPAPSNLSPALNHLSTKATPSHFSPAPSHFSPTPRHFSPAPSNLSPAPSHFPPAPNHLSPASNHMSPVSAPNHLSPAQNHSAAPSHLSSAPTYFPAAPNQLTHAAASSHLSSAPSNFPLAPNHLSPHLSSFSPIIGESASCNSPCTFLSESEFRDQPCGRVNKGLPVNENITQPPVIENFIPSPAVKNIIPPPAVENITPPPAVENFIPPSVIGNFIPPPAVKNIIPPPAVENITPPPPAIKNIIPPPAFENITPHSRAIYLPEVSNYDELHLNPPRTNYNYQKQDSHYCDKRNFRHLLNILAQPVGLREVSYTPKPFVSQSAMGDVNFKQHAVSLMKLPETIDPQQSSNDLSPKNDIFSDTIKSPSKPTPFYSAHNCLSSINQTAVPPSADASTEFPKVEDPVIAKSKNVESSPVQKPDNSHLKATETSNPENADTNRLTFQPPKAETIQETNEPTAISDMSCFTVKPKPENYPIQTNQLQMNSPGPGHILSGMTLPVKEDCITIDDSDDEDVIILGDSTRTKPPSDSINSYPDISVQNTLTKQPVSAAPTESHRSSDSNPSASISSAAVQRDVVNLKTNLNDDNIVLSDVSAQTEKIAAVNSGSCTVGGTTFAAFTIDNGELEMTTQEFDIEMLEMLMNCG